MITHKKVLSDMKEILSTIPALNKVRHGKSMALGVEDTFPAAYIQPASDVYELNTQGTSVAAYDNYFFIRVLLNINNEDDPLYWADIRDLVIRAVLDDKLIWDEIVDRDIVSVVYDDFENDQKNALEVIFEFRLRESCQT